MTENTSTSTITLTDTATALIKADVAAFTKDKKRYADYVVEMEVTAETVADHVAMFREAFKAASKKNAGDKIAIKAYATKVRNGLNYWVGKALTDDTEDQPVNYLTADGFAALAEMDDLDAVKAIHAEIERRAKK